MYRATIRYMYLHIQDRLDCTIGRRKGRPSQLVEGFDPCDRRHSSCSSGNADQTCCEKVVVLLVKTVVRRDKHLTIR